MMTLDQLFQMLKMGDYGIYVWLSFFTFVMIFIGLWAVPYCRLKNRTKS